MWGMIAPIFQMRKWRPGEKTDLLKAIKPPLAELDYKSGSNNFQSWTSWTIFLYTTWHWQGWSCPFLECQSFQLPAPCLHIGALMICYGNQQSTISQPSSFISQPSPFGELVYQLTSGYLIQVRSASFVDWLLLILKFSGNPFFLLVLFPKIHSFNAQKRSRQSSRAGRKAVLLLAGSF